MSNPQKPYTEEGHPCLCDVCLKARDAEISRVRSSVRQEGVEELRKIYQKFQAISDSEGFNRGWEYEFDNDLQESWNETMRQFKEFLEKEVKP